jgi:D-psicose/D-tagatose/L-ribulose 3-epimerase
MKLGCCINMFGTKQDPLGMQFIPAAKRTGYDYVEIPLAQAMDLGEDDFTELTGLLGKENLPCFCCNNFFPAGIRLTGEHTDKNQIREYMVKALERAVLLGAKCVVFGSSGARNVPEGWPVQKAYGQIIEVLHMIDGEAGKRNIRIAIEPISRGEGNIICSLTEAYGLCRDACCESVELLVDFYHFSREHENPEAIRKASGHIIHIHYSDPEKRSFPNGGDENARVFFRTLKECGYDGTVSVEAFSKEPERDLKKGLMIRDMYMK